MFEMRPTVKHLMLWQSVCSFVGLVFVTDLCFVPLRKPLLSRLTFSPVSLDWGLNFRSIASLTRFGTKLLHGVLCIL